MIIKNKHAHYSNSKFLFPEIGERQLIDGEVDVPDHVGQSLIKDGDQWVDTEAEDKAIDDESEAKESSISAENKAEMIESIKGMKHEELLEIAETSKIKGANLFKAPDRIEILRNIIIKNVEKL